MEIEQEPLTPPGTQPNGSEPPPSISTPPIETPSAPATDPKYVHLLEGTIAEQNRRMAALEERLAAGTVAPPAKPAKTKDELRQEFYDNPMEASRSVIREELAATIGPLQEFVTHFRGASAIDRLVETAKVNPRFAPHWSPALERYIREQAAGVNPSQLNDSTMNFLVASGIGLVTAGMLEGAAPSTPSITPPPPPPSSPAPMPTPPYMRPSGPPGPSDSPRTPPIEPLNENERRLLREYNSGKPADKQMSEADYRKWQNMPSADVAFTEFDKPKGGK